MFNNQIIAGAAGQGGGSFYSYSIDNSLRLQDISGSYLYQTENFATDNTWTFSCWIKRNLITQGHDQDILHVNNNDPWESFRFATDDSLAFSSFGRGGNTYVVNIYTYPIFRDISAWSHVMFVYDAGNGTAADRQRIYVNGERMSVEGGRFGSGTGSTNTSTTSNSALGAGYVIEIGGRDGNDPDADFQIAEVHFLDGYALTPTSFGETVNGVWVPIEYTGSYGQGGSYLDFSDSSDLGKDVSGQGNHWTSGAGISSHDQLSDSPTLNYPTWNPLVNTGQSLTFTEGNLNLDASGTFWSSGTWNQSTMGVLGGSDGKYYFEFTMNGNTSNSYVIGVGRQNSSAIDTTHYTGGVVYYNNRCSSDSTDTVTGLTIASSLTIIRLAFDASNGKVWIGDNSGWFNSGDPAAGTGEVGTISGYDGEMLVAILNRSTNTGDQVVNFGQDDTFAGFKTSGSASATDGNGYGTFYYTPPTGFLALNSASLPEPTISPNAAEQADDYFNTVLWSGDGTSSRGITGVGHAPDFVWIKTRNQNNEHSLFDSVRGVAKDLESNSSAAEQANNIYGYINSFDSDGFTVDAGSSGSALVNASGNTFVAWNWKAGGTAVSNTDGSTTSSVSAAPDAGFSILTYTADAATGTVGHGLNSAPEMVIAKPRNASGTNWYVMHTGALSANQVLNLDNTTAAFNPGENHFNDTFPTDTVVSYGGYMGNTLSGDDKLMYCFHSVEGYSRVSSYVGNGSSDGTFVYTGFRPAFVLLKKSSASGDNWSMYDNKRDVDNVVREYIIPNTTAAAASTDTVDFLSNGFKVRNSGAYINTSGATYIYLAFAETPQKFANAR